MTDLTTPATVHETGYRANINEWHRVYLSPPSIPAHPCPEVEALLIKARQEKIIP